MLLTLGIKTAEAFHAVETFMLWSEKQSNIVVHITHNLVKPKLILKDAMTKKMHSSYKEKAFKIY